MTLIIRKFFKIRGLNNPFQINSQSDLSKQYNGNIFNSDQSVLEMMHLTKAFEILRDPKANFLDKLDA